MGRVRADPVREVELAISRHIRKKTEREAALRRAHDLELEKEHRQRELLSHRKCEWQVVTCSQHRSELRCCICARVLCKYPYALQPIPERKDVFLCYVCSVTAAGYVEAIKQARADLGEALEGQDNGTSQKPPDSDGLIKP